MTQRYLLPKDVYTDSRIRNSINSALERGYWVVDFRIPKMGELVMLYCGTLRRLVPHDFPEKKVPMLIWEYTSHTNAHDILEGKF